MATFERDGVRIHGTGHGSGSPRAGAGPADVAPGRPEASPAVWAAYRAAMYDGDHPLFSVPTSVLPTVTAPVLVLQGDDAFHPRSASRLIADGVPGAAYGERWKGRRAPRGAAADRRVPGRYDGRARLHSERVSS